MQQPAGAGLMQATEQDGRRIQDGLVSMGVPFGLARLVAEEDRQIGLRIFLLDNSGSTATVDGKYLDTERMQMVPCSRWEEIRRMALQHAAMNAHVGTPCEFVLLNPPARRAFAEFQDGVDLAIVDAKRGPVQEQLAALEQMLQRTRPNGATPLNERLREIHHRLQFAHSDLVPLGLRSVVVVATDGLLSSSGSNLPSDQAKKEVVQTLRRLTSELPVFVVIRLATDDDSTTAYYNEIDAEEELPLEVIDDIIGEAQEAAENGNGWLTYSPMVHMIREGGTFIRLFDALDERQLVPLEARELASYMLQRDGKEQPLPSGLGADVCYAVENCLQHLPQVYDPIIGGMAPVLKKRKFRLALNVNVMAMVCGWPARHQHKLL